MSHRVPGYYVARRVPFTNVTRPAFRQCAFAATSVFLCNCKLLLVYSKLLQFLVRCNDNQEIILTVARVRNARATDL